MLPKRTLSPALLLVLGIGTVALGLTRMEAAARQDDADVAAKIDVATSAAPPAISADATIYDLELDDDGAFIVLREGSNGWSCFPDAPATPSIDPMCLEQTWMNWLGAFVAGKEPNTTVPGFAYMLQGGSDASNTDPFATEPAAGEEWVSSPAHVMLIMPGELDQSAFSTDHDSGGPYIMMPVADFEHDM